LYIIHRGNDGSYMIQFSLQQTVSSFLNRIDYARKDYAGIQFYFARSTHYFGIFSRIEIDEISNPSLLFGFILH